MFHFYMLTGETEFRKEKSTFNYFKIYLQKTATLKNVIKGDIVRTFNGRDGAGGLGGSTGERIEFEREFVNFKMSSE